MAINQLAPTGLTFARNVTTGAASYEMFEAKIVQDYGRPIARGDFLKLVDGYVWLAEIGDTLDFGVFISVLPYWDTFRQTQGNGQNGSYDPTASPVGDISCVVQIEPTSTFIAQISGGPFVQSWVGEYIDWLAGTNGVPDASGQSTLILDGASISSSTTALPFQIVQEVLPPTGNPMGLLNPWVEVRINNSLFTPAGIGPTGMTGVTGPTGPTAEAGFTGPLDLVPGAAFAYSQRAMKASGRGGVIYTVRRDSDDALFDVVSDAVTGAADTTGVVTFLGAANGFVFSWQEQSVGDNPASQSTNADQPAWESDVIAGAPAFIFDGATQFLATPGSALPNGAYTWFAVVNTNPELDGGRIMGINNAGGSNVNGPDWVAGISSTQVRGFADGAGFVNGNGEAFTPATDTTLYTIVDAGWNASGGTGFQNGAALSGSSDNIYGDGSVGAITFPMGVGVDDAITPSSFYQGGMIELLVYPTLLSSGDRLALRQNIAAYYGITL